MDISLAIFDLATTTANRDTDEATGALAATLSTLGLPIRPAEIAAIGGVSTRDTIEQLLLRYSPEQASGDVIDRLLAQFNLRLGEMRRDQSVRPVEGAEEVFHWLHARGIKVALKSALKRSAVGELLTTLGWNTRVA